MNTANDTNTKEKPSTKIKLKTATIYCLLAGLFNFEIQACEFTGISFNDDFSSARLDACEQQSASTYLLTIDPENTPINPSPWYAFTIKSEKKRQVTITIDYGTYKSRYLPKISYDGEHWQTIEHQVKDGDLNFQLKLKAGTTWVAGQEIINNAFYQRWLTALDAYPGGKSYVLGHSSQMRHIGAFEHRNKSNEWVVITGRMHPPEITGAIALFPFVETLLTEPQWAAAFQARFNLLVVPNLNPDGVEHGNWRHNANGIDLNRDWLKFEQAETQLVRDKLNQIVAAGGKIIYAIDFHSTSKNIFYTMPVDYGLKPAGLTTDWLQALNQLTPDFKVIQQPGSNPDKGVFKQYIADQFGAHAITYEMADNYDRTKIRAVAQKAAISFMQTLLNTQADEFK